MKKIIKKIFHLIGFEITSTKYIVSPPDAFEDQKKILAGQKSVTIFDVGAHHGQTALAYTKLFDTPQIFSFEPFGESYTALTNTVKPFGNIKTFNTALSNITGEVEFHSNQSSATNSILPTHKEGAAVWDVDLLDTIHKIKVPVTTVDAFIASNNISHVDVLKIDTQGTEYLVIEGALQSIKAGKIKMIYMEILTLPTYENQKKFDEILLLLRTNGFELHNIYNTSLTKNGVLRQVDALFVYTKI
ncbi:FkbM family methyltransferase [Cytophaga aurantiaca]|uniref:FkbM family methyltransferase n=1 Tax=Cytophaga aurantiaca TaxID=29530 RepID=UPI000364B392|nr:FkbM family methyltransferase [Cytophaga aurantiaca]